MAKIQAGGVRRRRTADSTVSAARPRLVAEDIDGTTVYFRVSGEGLTVDGDPELHPVAAPASDSFEQAAHVVRNAMTHVAATLRASDSIRPDVLEIEIAFGFAVKGRATIVPVILSGESSATASLKITATWSTPSVVTPVNASRPESSE